MWFVWVSGKLFDPVSMGLFGYFTLNHIRSERAQPRRKEVQLNETKIIESFLKISPQQMSFHCLMNVFIGFQFLAGPTLEWLIHIID